MCGCFRYVSVPFGYKYRNGACGISGNRYSAAVFECGRNIGGVYVYCGRTCDECLQLPQKENPYVL